MDALSFLFGMLAVVPLLVIQALLWGRERATAEEANRMLWKHAERKVWEFSEN